MKSVHHFRLISSAVKFCFSLLSNTLCGFPCSYPGFWGGQSSGDQVLCSYIYEQWYYCKNDLYAPDRLSCSGSRQLHCANDIFPESVLGLRLYGYDNLPSGVSGSCNKHFGIYPAVQTASEYQIHYDIVQ